MAGLRVFVSSTCYDYSLLRSELRNFIISMGYDPIMSDYADVLYDPRIHTHASCVDEVNNCDMLVVIIGSRFGGKSVPEALKRIDFSALSLSDTSKSAIALDQPVSITQLEVLKAIERNIPVYTFIEKKVYYEHEVYEKNKSVPDVLSKIVFPAIDKQETAQYIFGFIDFVRLRSIGNSIFQFERIQEIEEILKKQWSGYFQRLLFEQRHIIDEHRRLDALDDKFEDLKTAILSSIENVDQRETARGIVHYRRLTDFLFGLQLPQSALIESTYSFGDLLRMAEIKDIVSSRQISPEFERHMPPRLFLVKFDDSFYIYRASINNLDNCENDWNSFRSISQKSKEIILDALHEMYRPNGILRYHSEPFQQYIDERIVSFSQTSDE